MGLSGSRESQTSPTGSEKPEGNMNKDCGLCGTKKGGGVRPSGGAVFRTEWELIKTQSAQRGKGRLKGGEKTGRLGKVLLALGGKRAFDSELPLRQTKMSLLNQKAAPVGKISEGTMKGKVQNSVSSA